MNHGMPPVKQEQPISLTHPQHERLYRIFKMLSDGGYPNCNDFVDEFETTRRTVLRDLDYMRDRMNLPVKFDRSHNGYYFTEPVKSLPMIDISESDLVLLFVAERVAAQCGSELGRRVQSSFARLASVLGDSIRTTWHDLESLLSFRTTGVGKAELDAFELLQKCVKENKVVSFRYQGTNDQQARIRTVHPYHLGLVNNQWYLFAWDPSREAMRTFSLARLRSPRATGKNFESDSSISVPSLLGDSLGVAYKPKGTGPVRIRFAPDLAKVIAERVWHPSQKIQKAKDGSLEITLGVADTKELRNWIMSWGPRAEVLAPPQLRETIASLAQATAKIYSGRISEQHDAH